MRDPGQDRDDWVRSIVSPSAPPRRPAEPGAPQRPGVGFLVCLSLVLMLTCWVLLVIADSRYEQRRLYEDHAIATTAIVTGFEAVKPRKGPASLKTVVEFDAGGYRIRTRLMLARLVLPEQREAWVGRAIAIRYLPGQPDTAIAVDAMHQLPHRTDGWALLVLAVAGSAMCLHLAIAEWRRARREASL